MMAALIWSEKGKDEDGFPIEKEQAIEVYAEEKSIVRSEFYEAMRSGQQIRIVLEMRQEDFALSRHDNKGRLEYAAKVKYDGEAYTIIRVYKKGKSKVELTCG